MSKASKKGPYKIAIRRAGCWVLNSYTTSATRNARARHLRARGQFLCTYSLFPPRRA